MGELKVEYPYWLDDYNKEMKGITVWYREEGWKRNHEDIADGHRVFMILCNNNSDKSRMEVLKMLQDATEENPVMINNDKFWCERD